MPCVHLKQLFQLCEEHQLKIGGADLIHIVCEQCGVQEVCPSMLTDEYDAREKQELEEQREKEQSAFGRTQQ